MIVAWLGAQPPSAIAAALSRVGQVRTGWSPDAEIVVVWASSGPSTLADLPGAGAGSAPFPPILIAFDHDPTPEERRVWRRAGGELVPADRLADILVERVRAERERQRSTDPSAAVSPSAAVARDRPARAPIVEAQHPAGIAQVEGAPMPVSGHHASPTDAFPPLRVAFPSGGPPAAVASYVESLQRYIQARDNWSGQMGPLGLGQLMELFHLREQVPPTSSTRRPVVFGQTYGNVEQQLGWPLLLRRGPSRRRQGNDVLRGSVFAAGTDGFIVDVDFQAAPRQKLVGDLPVDANNNAQLLFEARWQRRVGAARWHIGLLILEMRLRPVEP